MRFVGRLLFCSFTFVFSLCVLLIPQLLFVLGSWGFHFVKCRLRQGKANGKSVRLRASNEATTDTKLIQMHLPSFRPRTLFFCFQPNFFFIKALFMCTCTIFPTFFFHLVCVFAYFVVGFWFVKVILTTKELLLFVDHDMCSVHTLTTHYHWTKTHEWL